MTALRSLPRRIYESLEQSHADGTSSERYSIVDLALIVLIGVNLVSLTLETIPALTGAYGEVFGAIETFSVLVFTVEYLVRLAVCTQHPRYRHPVTGRLRFAATPLLLIDLISILPFYLPVLIGADLRFIRVIRFLRFLRVLKLGRYSASVRTLGRVFTAKRHDLALTLVIIGLLVILSSCAMYFAENPGQPDAFSSIPAAMWWSIATITTVGYGDITPVTALGKLLGAVVAVLGVGLIALPTGIIAAGFSDELRHRPRISRGARSSAPDAPGADPGSAPAADTRARCPHCGANLGE